jgi:hypothetical protein
MKDANRDPERLVGGAEPRTREERWLRRAFSEAAELTASREPAASVFVRRAAPRRLPRRWLQVALAIAVVTIAGATLAAYQRFVRPHLASGGGAAAPASEQVRAHRALASARPEPEVPAATPEPAPPPVAAPPPAPETRPRPPLRAAEAPRPAAALPLERPRWPGEAPRAKARPPEEPAGAPPTEARVLARALAHLRASRDAGAALADLDERDRLFPNGLLSLEALRIRTEALLDLGREREALAALDGAGRATLTPPLSLVRGELRARVGRCPEALEDLGPLAADEATPAALAERALYARASCHAKLHDVATARADLERYEARFPSGAFHDAADAFLRATAP